MDEPLIDLREVAIGFGGRPLLPPLSLTVRRGELWGVVGPNGAGKTTLLKTMVGLLPAVAGAVAYASPRPRFGYVPQRQAVDLRYPLSALEVAAMGRYERLPLGRWPRATDLQAARDELARVGLAEQAGRRFAALSGGQQQRVLLARALCGQPDVLVLDEPTSGMDIAGEADLLAFLRALHAARSLTIVMISHHLGSVISVADQLCLINKDHQLFEAGPARDLLSAERLSAVYRRPLAIDRCGADPYVHVHQHGADRAAGWHGGA